MRVLAAITAIAGMGLCMWSVTRPLGFIPGYLIGTGLIVWAFNFRPRGLNR